MLARIAAVLFFCLAPHIASAQIINYERGDPEMAAAYRDALRTLPLFVEALKKGTAEQFHVKVPLAREGGREIIWMGDVKIEGEEFVGRIANVPRHQKEIVKGSPYRLKQEDIIDWYFMRDGKMHGSFSTRVMLKRMPPEQAKEMQKILAPVPDI
jgi:uncharacterized protein YegJ (DUF2314 family)